MEPGADSFVPSTQETSYHPQTYVYGAPEERSHHNRYKREDDNTNDRKTSGVLKNPTGQRSEGRKRGNNYNNGRQRQRGDMHYQYQTHSEYGYEQVADVTQNGMTSNSGPLVIGFIGFDVHKSCLLLNSILERNSFRGDVMLDGDGCVVQQSLDTEKNILYLTLSHSFQTLRPGYTPQQSSARQEWLSKEDNKFIRSVLYLFYVCHHVMFVHTSDRINSQFMTLLSHIQSAVSTLDVTLQSMLPLTEHASAVSGCDISFIFQTNSPTESKGDNKKTRESTESHLDAELRNILKRLRLTASYSERIPAIVSMDPTRLAHVAHHESPIRQPSPLIDLFKLSIQAELGITHEGDTFDYGPIRVHIETVRARFFAPRKNKSKEWVTFHGTLERVLDITLHSFTCPPPQVQESEKVEVEEGFREAKLRLAKEIEEMSVRLSSRPMDVGT
ncbi:hypothetical protein PROFUN_04773 [Planoprotostelium fungivorum]|uniref:Nonsense-mediated mRNA decay factor SMG8 n=1 Tax=Planoprotostelium fungivorum TaxID=1890364 RepID=A0A2P6NSU6_9EUKA|nr:hypothetical protein PROFUN_04773 [Planoprotostelium fungivorum]